MQCVECQEPITNPICPECLEKGILQWAHEEGNMVLAKEVRSLTDGLIIRGTTNCVRCGDAMEVCAYCYTKSVFDLVKQYPAHLPAYLLYFNFDLEHMGWEREARILLGE